MYSQLAVIVLIDVEQALKVNALCGHTYLIDNARFMGSSQEASEHLVTRVVGSRIVNWLTAGIDMFGNQPYPLLVGIGGEAVDKQIMVPQLFDSPALDGSRGLWWGATVDARVQGIYRYTLRYKIGTAELEFTSSIDVRPGFTREETAEQAAAEPAVAAPAVTSARRAASSVEASAMADGSIFDPKHHVSLLSHHQMAIVRRLRSKIQS